MMISLLALGIGTSRAQRIPLQSAVAHCWTPGVKNHPGMITSVNQKRVISRLEKGRSQGKPVRLVIPAKFRTGKTALLARSKSYMQEKGGITFFMNLGKVSHISLKRQLSREAYQQVTEGRTCNDPVKIVQNLRRLHPRRPILLLWEEAPHENHPEGARTRRAVEKLASMNDSGFHMIVTAAYPTHREAQGSNLRTIGRSLEVFDIKPEPLGSYRTLLGQLAAKTGLRFKSKSASTLHELSGGWLHEANQLLYKVGENIEAKGGGSTVTAEDIQRASADK